MEDQPKRLVSAKSLSFGDAIAIVRKRAELMQGAVLNLETQMAAIIGLSSDKISSICENINNNNGCVSVANYNSELQRSYFRGYNTAQLLLKLSIKENNRNGLYDSLIGENFINGEGFFFVPSSINKNVNSSSQILEFNGTSFLSKGLFHSDSLHNTSLENQ